MDPFLCRSFSSLDHFLLSLLAVAKFPKSHSVRNKKTALQPRALPCNNRKSMSLP